MWQDFLGHQPKAQEVSPDGEYNVRALISRDPMGFYIISHEPSHYRQGRELLGIGHRLPFLHPSLEESK